MQNTTSIKEFIREHQWEHPDNYWGATWEDYIVVLGRTRDSNTLNNCNFEVALEQLGGEVSGVVEVARSGHWACGWVEQIMVKKTRIDKIRIAKRISDSLADYPILDESAYSEAECEYMGEVVTQFYDQFHDTLLEYFKLPTDLKVSKAQEKVLNRAVYNIFEADCSYQGSEEAFVTPESIRRYLKATYIDSLEIRTDLLKLITKLGGTTL